ncbi:MAG: ATP synthase subunit A [Methanocellales archaeon]
MADGKEKLIGKIYRVSGPVVTAIGMFASMYDLVRVGHEKLMGEVIQIVEDKVIIQVYEDTSGLKPGDPIENTGLPLSVELGPGLLTSIYDGVQRPLPILVERAGNFISRGIYADGIDRKKKWEFVPVVKKGQEVKAGDIIGTVQETETIEHRIMIPPNISGGKVKEIKDGKFTVEETICILEDGTEIKMMHKWPTRLARPFKEKLLPDVPLITGQRIFDTLFPVAKGGTAAIPGPFGSGKTVMLHQFAKWSDAKIVVYIGCGERGNEMTEVLTEFPHLIDPYTGKPLMYRTVLIANTSNMPVAAREASVYTGITIAEYYRDMGYDVALMADSTSRWAEAMREISSRLEEMPGEEGYPAYLAAKLAEFYERSGRVITLNGREGSVTVLGAVSPPGGDLSEPVSQGTLRIVKVFWALDAKLAYRRHFPAINWLISYSLYQDVLRKWFSQNVSPEWSTLVARAMEILGREAELQAIVQLVGADALPEDQQLLLEIARMIRDYYLQQSAFHDVDTYCEVKKQYEMLKAILAWGDTAKAALASGIPLDKIKASEAKVMLSKAKFQPEYHSYIESAAKVMEEEFRKMKAE